MSTEAEVIKTFKSAFTFFDSTPPHACNMAFSANRRGRFFRIAITIILIENLFQQS